VWVRRGAATFVAQIRPQRGRQVIAPPRKRYRIGPGVAAPTTHTGKRPLPHHDQAMVAARVVVGHLE
jgi:hypothetical protein